MSQREDLENLLKSPGWLLFQEHAQTEWQANINRHLETALNDTDDALAANKMRQVIAAKKAIDALLQWPKEKLQRLTQKDEAQALAQATVGWPEPSRRGGF